MAPSPFIIVRIYVPAYIYIYIYIYIYVYVSIPISSGNKAKEVYFQALFLAR